MGIEFVDNWNAGSKVEFEDLLFGEFIELHDNGAKAVAVCGN